MNRILQNLKQNWITYGFETLVVIAGILIAYSLNNWNEERKEEALESQYLERLVIDLASDTSYYQRRIDNLKREETRLMEMIKEIYKEQKSLSDVKNLMASAYITTEHLTTQNYTYIQLLNSGDLSVFTNEHLKTQIVNYYRENERATVHVKEYNESVTTTLLEVGNKVPILKFIPANDDIFDSENMFNSRAWLWLNDVESYEFRAFENAYTYYIMRDRTFQELFKSLKDQAKELINEINTTTNNR